MDNSQKKRKRARFARLHRVRNKVRGTMQRPRLSVSKTNSHLSAQLIDDERGITIAGFGTLSKAITDPALKRKSKDAARHIGTQIAEIAKQNSIQAVIFDRGRCKYHGIIAELATAAREAGLQF